MLGDNQHEWKNTLVFLGLTIEIVVGHNMRTVGRDVIYDIYVLFVVSLVSEVSFRSPFFLTPSRRPPKLSPMPLYLRRAVADAASDYLQIIVFFPQGQISELQRCRLQLKKWLLTVNQRISQPLSAWKFLFFVRTWSHAISSYGCKLEQ